MKAFGKIAVLAMTLALAGVLTACGGSASSGSASGSASEASASAAVSSAAASSEAASSAASAASFEPGTLQADTYTNEFFGVKFTLPEGFAFYDEAQMADMNKSVGSLVSEDIAKALESGVAFFDMAAATEDGTNVNVVIEYAGTPAAQALDSATYLEYAKENLASQLSSSGVTVKEAEIGKYKNVQTGDEFDSMKLQIEMQGIPMYEELVCLKSGDYFMSITATSQDEADLEKILENLTLVK